MNPQDSREDEGLFNFVFLFPWVVTVIDWERDAGRHQPKAHLTPFQESSWTSGTTHLLVLQTRDVTDSLWTVRQTVCLSCEIPWDSSSFCPSWLGRAFVATNFHYTASEKRDVMTQRVSLVQDDRHNNFFFFLRRWAFAISITCPVCSLLSFYCKDYCLDMTASWDCVVVAQPLTRSSFPGKRSSSFEFGLNRTYSWVTGVAERTQTKRWDLETKLTDFDPLSSYCYSQIPSRLFFRMVFLFLNRYLLLWIWTQRRFFSQNCQVFWMSVSSDGLLFLFKMPPLSLWKRLILPFCAKSLLSLCVFDWLWSTRLCLCRQRLKWTLSVRVEGWSWRRWWSSPKKKPSLKQLFQKKEESTCKYHYTWHSPERKWKIVWQEE